LLIEKGIGFGGVMFWQKDWSFLGFDSRRPQQRYYDPIRGCGMEFLSGVFLSTWKIKYDGGQRQCRRQQRYIFILFSLETMSSVFHFQKQSRHALKRSK